MADVSITFTQTEAAMVEEAIRTYRLCRPIVIPSTEELAEQQRKRTDSQSALDKIVNRPGR